MQKFIILTFIVFLFYTEYSTAQCEKTYTELIADQLTLELNTEIHSTDFDSEKGECTYNFNISASFSEDHITNTFLAVLSRQRDINFHTDWIRLIESSIRFFAIRSSEYTFFDYNRVKNTGRLVFMNPELDLMITDDFFILFDLESLIGLFNRGINNTANIFERYGYRLTSSGGRQAFYKTYNYRGQEIASVISFWEDSFVVSYLNDNGRYPPFLIESYSEISQRLSNNYIATSGKDRIHTISHNFNEYAVGIGQDKTVLSIQIKRI